MAGGLVGFYVAGALVQYSDDYVDRNARRDNISSSTAMATASPQSLKRSPKLC